MILFLHILWIVLAVINFLTQLLYFVNDDSKNLFLIKKITTPLLLFSGLVIVVVVSRSFPLIPCLILLAMGLGELGIEGSSVVEAGEGHQEKRGSSSIIVLAAGVLFLLVNIFIGIYLILQGAEVFGIIITGLFSSGLIFVLLRTIFRIFKPKQEISTQLILYSIGLVILMTGIFLDLSRGFSRLGVAAALLTLSDSLVLFRMGADFKKSEPKGFKILLVLLIIILILYYIYMGLLINIGLD